MGRYARLCISGSVSGRRVKRPPRASNSDVDKRTTRTGPCTRRVRLMPGLKFVEENVIGNVVKQKQTRDDSVTLTERVGRFL